MKLQYAYSMRIKIIKNYIQKMKNLSMDMKSSSSSNNKSRRHVNTNIKN
ncbi:MAG TPA: hypothetical protein VHF08_01815 [Nitrososphaeraceae archaeon]|nr:hypothetical protein [Nitrososphaeraceae archaeon]